MKKYVLALLPDYYGIVTETALDRLTRNNKDCLEKAEEATEASWKVYNVKPRALRNQNLKKYMIQMAVYELHKTYIAK